MVMESQFFSCVPAKKLQLPEGFVLSPLNQRKLIVKLFEHPLYHSYPPPVTYRLTFLKWCLSQVESQEHEVCDELYELYGSLVSQPQPADNSHCFKSYCIGHKWITLKESANIISDGTTGLTTWQAAFFFLEWALNNIEQFSEKHVLELGSGVGLVGLAVCSVCSPSSYCFTDCNQQVLSLLSHNIHLNFPSGTGDTSVCVKILDWSGSADAILSTYSQPLDYIVATDVIYDNQLIDAFTQVLAVLLRQWHTAVAFVTSTIRNEETYKYFISKLKANHITQELLEIETTPPMFHFDRTLHFEILKLKYDTCIVAVPQIV